MFKLRDFRDDKKGSLTVIFGFSLSALVIGIGIAADLSGLVKKSNDTQYLADMAVLAAVASEEKTPWALEAIAQRVVTANTKAGDSYNTVFTLNEDRTMRVDVTAVQKLQFMSAFGYEEKTITSYAIAAPIGIGKLNLALVIDITDETPGGLVSGLTGVIDDTIDEVDNVVASTLGTGLYDLVEDNTDIMISVVPFSQYVKIPESYAGDPWLDLEVEDEWEGCVGSRNAPWNARPEYSTREFTGLNDVSCQGDIQPLTTNIEAVKNAILSVNTSDDLYIPAGLMWGWRTLSRDVPFTEADTTDYKDRSRVMLLISDGGNIKSMGGGDDDSEGNYHEGDNAYGTNTLTAEICDDIKNDGIIIYAAAVGVEDGTTLNVIKNCATDPLKFINAVDNIAIELLLGKLRQDMSQVRLSG